MLEAGVAARLRPASLLLPEPGNRLSFETLPSLPRILAGSASLALHACFLVSLGLSFGNLRPEHPTTPFRMSGQTFEVDPANYIPVEVEQAPASSSATAPAQASPPLPSTPAPSPPTEQAPPELSDSPSADSAKQSAALPPIAKRPEPPIKQALINKPNIKQPIKQPSAPNSPPAPPAEGSSTVDPQTKETTVKATGSYGQAGPPGNTLDLFRAFLKTLPLSAKLNQEWAELPPGPAGEIEFTLSLDGEGHLRPIRVTETRDPPPSYLRNTVTKTRGWLLQGTFALNQPSASATTLEELPKQRLKLSAKVSRRPPDPDNPTATSIRAFGLEGTPPDGAYFTYFNGQHVELNLERLP